jgi:uncharacterized protein (DUF58 family)
VTGQSRWGRLVVPCVLLAGILAFAPAASFRVIAAAVLLVTLVAFLSTRLAARLVSVRRETDVLRVNRSQPFAVRLVVESRWPLPLVDILVTDAPGGLRTVDPTTFLLQLGPMERRVVSWTAEAHERGAFTVGPVHVAGPAAFGLGGWARTERAVLEVIAYPAAFPLALAHRPGLPSGNVAVASRLYEDVTRFRSIREYVSGDEPRRISWKVSARLGRLATVEYSPAISVPTLVLLDLAAPHYPVARRYALLERAIEVAASLVTHFTELKQQVGLIASGAVGEGGAWLAVPLRAGADHAMGILEALALVRPSADPVPLVELALRSGVGIPAGTRICAVVPPLSAEAGASLHALRRRGHAVEAFFLVGDAARSLDTSLAGAVSHEVTESGTELLDG